jgi:hypothetical protein
MFSIYTVAVVITMYLYFVEIKITIHITVYIKKVNLLLNASLKGTVAQDFWLLSFFTD